MTPIRFFFSAALTAGLGFAVPAASGQTFTNSTPINILDLSPASPYPSTITVAGAPTSGGNVSIRINGFSHTYPADVIMVVQGPGGQTVGLSQHCGGEASVSGVTLTFSQNATQSLGVPFTTGTYLTTYCDFDFNLPDPGPAGPYSVDLSVFQGTNPNGTWSLWVADQVGNDAGSISGGWSVIVDPPANVTPSPSAFTYQGVVKDAGAPVTGSLSARFRLFDADSGGNRLGPSLLVPIAPQNGQFSTLLDFGAAALDPGSPRWLEVAVNGAVLTPRQLVSNAPMATKAAFAATAGSASSVPWTSVTGVPANVSGAFSPWTTATGGIAYSGGSVGIGTTAPQSRLHVSGGNIQLDTGLRLQFGAAGENGDTMFLSRFNYLPAQSGIQMELGSNGTVGANNDTFIITESGTTLFQFNTQSGGQALKAGGGSWGALSDARAKHDIAPLDGALDRLLQLRGRSFVYNDPKAPGAAGGVCTGFVAQEVEPIFPEWIGQSGDMLTINIKGFEALTVEALRQLRSEHESEVDALRRQQAALSAENADLKSRLERLERVMQEARDK